MATCSRLLRRLVVYQRCHAWDMTCRLIHSRQPLFLPTPALNREVTKVQCQQRLHTSAFLSQGNVDEAGKEEEGLSPASKKSLSLTRSLFKEAANKSKSKESFFQLMKTFGDVDKRRRGHLQFIETALMYMKHFNVEKDIEAYNKLLDVFPKGVYVSRNVWQVIFNHFPEQQTMALKVLQRLEDNKLMPNNETKRILLEAFGRQSHPVKKYQRLMYWFPKFRNINPFPLPHELPTDPATLAELGLKRICEYEAELKMVENEDIDPSSDNADFMTSAQSLDQQDLLSQHPPYRPLFVEGPFNLWLRDVKLGYYILRSDAIYLESLEGDMMKEEENLDDFSMSTGSAIKQEQLEGPVYAMCMTSNGSQDRLSHWIRTLQEDNPHLARLPVVFNLFKKESPAEDTDRRLDEGVKPIDADS